jgi:hypothetical protein
MYQVESKEKKGKTGKKQKINSYSQVSPQDLPHGHGLQISPFMSSWIFLFVLIYVNKELSEAPFFKETHQRRSEGFLGSCGDLDSWKEILKEIRI